MEDTTTTGIMVYELGALAFTEPVLARERLLSLPDADARKVIAELEADAFARLVMDEVGSHMALLTLMEPAQVQQVMDRDPDLYSVNRISLEEAAYWIRTFCEEGDDSVFLRHLRGVDLVALAMTIGEAVREPASPAFDEASGIIFFDAFTITSGDIESFMRRLEALDPGLLIRLLQIAWNPEHALVEQQAIDAMKERRGLVIERLGEEMFGPGVSAASFAAIQEQDDEFSPDLEEEEVCEVEPIEEE